jgi:hypothetical protein
MSCGEFWAGVPIKCWFAGFGSMSIFSLKDFDIYNFFSIRCDRIIVFDLISNVFAPVDFPYRSCPIGDRMEM